VKITTEAAVKGSTENFGQLSSIVFYYWQGSSLDPCTETLCRSNVLAQERKGIGRCIHDV